MALTQTPLPQVALTLQAVTDATTSFNAHYTLANSVPVTPGSIAIPWTSFQTAVEVNGGITPITQILLRFIHRFDGTNWFLTMEVNQMNLQNGAIMATGNRFDLLPNNTIVASTFAGNFDPNYFANVLFNNAPMDPAIYVNSVLMPYYQEISEIVCQDGLPYTDPNTSVVFASCTFDYTALMPVASLVPLPHTVNAYMTSTAHGPYLDNIIYANLFQNKAGDFAGLCPPQCHIYNWPAGLPLVATCRV